MSHIDEGALHAYLDGALDSYPAGEAAQVRAHLDSCDECAQRLEEARAIREEAESILAPSAPVVQMPPLEDLRVLAKNRADTSRARGMSRVNRWGWAASVVLALGTGWMLRGSIPGTISRPTLPEQMAAPSVTTPAADEAGQGAADQSNEDRRQGVLGANVEAEPEAGPETDASAFGVAADLADATPEVAGDPADADLLEELITEQPDEQRAERRDVQVGGRDAPAAVGGLSPSAPAASAPGVAQERAVVVDSLARMREAEQRPAADQAERSKVARAAPAPAEVVALPSPTQDETSVGAMRRSEDLAAERFIQGLDEAGTLVVPGLEVVEVAGTDEAQAGGIVIVRQLMENGDILEIFHLPAGSESTAFPPPPTDGRTQVVATNGEGWIVMQANAERDQLEQYLQRILGG